LTDQTNITRRLVEFATRELDMAQYQLLLLGNGSAEEKVAIFLVSWRNRLARLNTLSETVPLPMRRQPVASARSDCSKLCMARSSLAGRAMAHLNAGPKRCR